MRYIAWILIADFLTGLFHWAEDTYSTNNWKEPLLSQVVLPNINHHKQPSAIAAMGNVFTRNYVSVFLFLCVFFVLFLIGFESLDLFCIGLLASFGNEVHVWNHRKADQNNRLIQFLQDACLVQTRAQHNKHHVTPYDRYYCTLTNVMNAALESIHFWRIVERLLFVLFSLSPARGTQKRDGY